MSKTNFSISIDTHLYILLVELAKKKFEGKISRAIECIVKSSMRPEKLAEFMAKQACADMNQWLQIKEEWEKNPDLRLNNSNLYIV